MVLLEAWAWGKPVLMTPQCNLPAGFAAGAALRIEPGVEAIAQGLEDFFAMDDARAASHGRARPPACAGALFLARHRRGNDAGLRMGLRPRAPGLPR